MIASETTIKTMSSRRTRLERSNIRIISLGIGLGRSPNPPLRKVRAFARSLRPVRSAQRPRAQRPNQKLLVSRRRDKNSSKRFELFQAFARADRDTTQRRLGDVDRHPGFVLQALVQAFQQRAPTR